MVNSKLEKLIKQYSVFQWLFYIKVLENMTEEEINKITIDLGEQYSLRNTNWYSIIMDLAMRFSSYDKQGSVGINDVEMSQVYLEFIPRYVNHHDQLAEHVVDLDYDLYLSLSRLMYEQLKNYSPAINGIGRLLTLYEKKENLFKQDFGLTHQQMILFYIVSEELHAWDRSLNSLLLFKLMKDLDSSVKKQHLDRFLKTFSSSTKDYRLRAKELNITKHTIKCRRLVYKYPIVKHDNMYMIPSVNILLDSLTYKIFDKLNEDSSESFKRGFGNEFENYIRSMTRHFHDKNMYECNELINKNKKRAEFYLEENGTCLVIEAKVLAIDEDMILNDKIEVLEKKFKNTVGDAIKQMNSCNRKLLNMYGLIVIHTHIPALNNFLQKYKSSLDIELQDKVVLMSVVEYENLISKSFKNIIKQINIMSQNPFNIIEGIENEFLRRKYTEYINPIIECRKKEIV